jgi:hypothetical protein
MAGNTTVNVSQDQRRGPAAIWFCEPAGGRPGAGYSFVACGLDQRRDRRSFRAEQASTPGCPPVTARAALRVAGELFAAPARSAERRSAPRTKECAARGEEVRPGILHQAGQSHFRIVR